MWFRSQNTEKTIVVAGIIDHQNVRLRLEFCLKWLGLLELDISSPLFDTLLFSFVFFFNNTLRLLFRYHHLLIRNLQLGRPNKVLSYSAWMTAWMQNHRGAGCDQKRKERRSSGHRKQNPLWSDFDFPN